MNKPDLSKLSKSSQAMLFLLAEFNLDVFCVESFHHKLKEPNWIIVPKRTPFKKFILGASSLEILLQEAIFVSYIYNMIDSHFGLCQHLVDKDTQFTANFCNCVNMFLLGRYSEKNVEEHFIVLNTLDGLQIQRRACETVGSIASKARELVGLAKWHRLSLNISTKMEDSDMVINIDVAPVDEIRITKLDL